MRARLSALSGYIGGAPPGDAPRLKNLTSDRRKPIPEENATMSRFIKTIPQDADFDGEVFGSPVPVLACFCATWGNHCKVLLDSLDRIGQDFQGRVKVVWVDIDDCPRTAKRYGINSIPTILAFNQGELRGSIAGPSTREQILQLIPGL
jgi:thioredoxin 1